MVKFKYKGNRTRFVRTDGGRVIAFHPGQVHEIDEDNKRSKELAKELFAFPDDFEVQRDVGAKGIGKGVRTGSRRSKRRGRPPKAKEEVKPPKSVIDKVKKPKGLKKPKKGKAK
tara:strand:- start:1835 stop:2176 length:342 start_codon:yes stop_codon:yes gene_type:complete